ncbi:potassium channel family protein [Sphingomonas daechungensis]|uniref:Two pore domain potassium channel family protein n=1 Tax=Sphingomonas daechungensis TaxID=1176646 RepID=A0ABX6T2W5_9SPHN|nr:ion channel [Sphingomonas daechungensis]QNP43058.1 two pore domain potassium channel family protein [Sphingomonas daechungensis]
MSDEVIVVDLGLQLAVVTAFIVLMVVVHSAGLVAISKVLHLHDDRAIPNEFGLRASFLMGTYGLLLFTLHFFEIYLFALFYRHVGALRSMEAALYYSASCYATLGSAPAHFDEEWRLLGSLEALIGFVLIGWSTAFMVGTLRKIIN